MPQERHPRLAWNRGLLSPLGAARIDLERHALAADTMVNWMVRLLGSMSLRVGLGYIGATASNDKSKGIAFVRSTDTVARLEVTENGLRIWIDDALVTRATVAATVTNGGFNTDVASWTDGDESGAVSAWLTGGYLSLIGTGSNAAIRTQQVTVTNAGVEHALRIVIQRGPVILRVGSTAGGDDYINETTLGTGTHSLAFTPSGDFHIRFMNRRIAASLVDSVAVEGAGVVSLPTPWTEAALASLRWHQSADVMYVASNGYQQRKIERREDTSWSIVLYEPEDGPFRLVNVTPVTIAASGLTGDITLTASAATFKSGHVGALFRLTSSGQLVTASLTGADQFTGTIRVVGVGGQRDFAIIITGTWVATVTLQYSFDGVSGWVDAASYTTNQSISYNDELDNQIIYYRIGIKAGNYTSGTAVATLSYSSGSAIGIVRITAFTSATSVSAAVLDALGGTAATADWNEGSWSTYRGWPTAVALHEGRLWWFGKDKSYGSVSDLYESFDDTMEGDSGPIQRSIGEGPVDDIHWALSLTRLLMGTAAMSANVAAVRIDGDSPIEARSSSFDEPLTPTNFNLKYSSARGVFVDRSAARLIDIGFDIDAQGYVPNDLSLLVPDLNESGIIHLAVQYKPDLRFHCVRNDGSVGVLVFDRAENVTCWLEVQTLGTVEDVVVLPGEVEDQVYYTVLRNIGGTVRYHEKWALESECIGGNLNKQADAFISQATVDYINIVSVTTSIIAHSITVGTSTAHGLAVSDVIEITGMVASGTYLLDGSYTVSAVTSTTTFRIVVTSKQWPTGLPPTGSYVSGGTFASGLANVATGLTHLEGQSVVAWGDGKDLGTYTVSGGQITLSENVTEVVVGIPYTADWRGTKNAFAAALGTPLSQPKMLEGVGLVLKDTHCLGVQYGQDFDHLNDLPQGDLDEVSPSVPDTDTIYAEEETRMLPADGQWATDSRLCLRATAPRPCTVLAAVVQMTTND